MFGETEMAGKTIFEMESPKTQTVESVKALAAYLNKPIEAGVLDLGTAKLVLSNKKDCYYVTTEKACSCPSATYRPGSPCKHSRKYFPQPKPTQAREAEVDAELAKEKGAKRLARPVDSIRPTGKWHGHNGPVAPEEARPKSLLQEMEAEGYKTSFEPEEVA